MSGLNVKSTCDLAIIGGGIIGLAAARQVLIRHPKLAVCVIEKEKQLATHQSNRNSGVVHQGIYYKKNSLRSRFCIKGARLAKEYCESKGLPYQKCGKLIIATKQSDLKTLHDLFSNAQSNNVQDIELVSKTRAEEIQPGCSKVIEAIWSPNTAIVEWRKVALSYAQDFESCGGKILTNFTASRLEPTEDNQVLIKYGKTGDAVKARSVLNCAGAFSDYFVRQTGNDPHPMVVPFKGNYSLLSPRLADTIKTNIYPVPDPKLPFLGVHITPRIDGSVLVGPTALLTLNYEKYDSNSSFNIIQMFHILFKTGLINMMRHPDYLKAALKEIRVYTSESDLADIVRELLPDLKDKDLISTDFCGIRAQVVSKDGKLVDDFFFETGLQQEFNKVLHVRNSPSPAATSSLAIAERLVGVLEERFI